MGRVRYGWNAQKCPGQGPPEQRGDFGRRGRLGTRAGGSLLMMIRSSRRGRARETARGSADGLIGAWLRQRAASSDWAGLSWGWMGGSLKSSRATASQQLHSFRGSWTFFLMVFVDESSRACDVCSEFFFGCPASDTRSLVSEFCLFFSFRGARAEYGLLVLRRNK